MRWVSILLAMVLLTTPITEVPRKVGIKQQPRINQIHARELLIQRGVNHLPVNLILQNPSLPNGCEATSLAMVLEFYGYEIPKEQLAFQYIPREDFYSKDGVRYGANPDWAYVGNPSTEEGFYCFVQPLVCGANVYLKEQESAYRLQDISGATMQRIDRFLIQGSPVILWTTRNFTVHVSYSNYTWQLQDGTVYTPYRNLHCVVLNGYNRLAYSVCDPLLGEISVDKDVVIESYLAMGAYAAVMA